MKRNRHHILYPQAAWLRLGPIGSFLRGAFIIRINKELHAQLHHEIDKTLGGYVWSDHLPRKCTLMYLEKELKRDEELVKTSGPIGKIDWLMDRLSYSDSHSYWLKTMLRRQREFLIEHQEEI